MDACKDVNSNIILLIFCIIIIILVISMFILFLNILSYILFTIYCISDNAIIYMAEDPESIILGETYKYKLLNYVKNSNYKQPKEGETYNSFVKYDFDSGSSDIYIHKAIVYYNYIAKLLLLIMFLLVIGVLYNAYIKLTSWSSGCNQPSAVCEFLLIEIFSKDTYIYYIIILLFAYIFIHSYMYTSLFNKSIYFDLYSIYAKKENKYKEADTIVYESINYIKDYNPPVPSGADAAVKEAETKAKAKDLAEQYLKSLANLSFNEVSFNKFLNKDNTMWPDYDDRYKNLLNYGIQVNNKFVIPNSLEGADDFNEVLTHICDKEEIKSCFVKATDVDIATATKLRAEKNGIMALSGDSDNPDTVDLLDKDVKEATKMSVASQELLANKIFLYLIYHYVITNNIEDPLIIHKLNNIYMDLFTNIYNLLKSKELKEGKKDVEYTDDFLERFSVYIKKMYKDIKCSYTVKLLLPIVTKKQEVLDDIHSNADDLLKLLSKMFVVDGTTADDDKPIYGEIKGLLETYKDDNNRYSKIGYTKSDADKKDKLYVLKYKISKKIRDFADNGFTDYYQEDKTSNDINTIVYKINLYLALDMLQTVICILVVLFILYKSNKYPYLELYIKMAMTYAIVIINEVISAILGIV